MKQRRPQWNFGYWWGQRTPPTQTEVRIAELRDNHSGDDPEVHWAEHQGEVVELESGTVQWVRPMDPD